MNENQSFKRIRYAHLPMLKNSTKIALGIFLIMLIMLGIKFFTIKNIANIADLQLEAIRSGDMVKAYSINSNAFHEHISLQDFKSFVDSYPILKSNKNIQFTEKSFEGNFGYLNGIIEGNDGSKMMIEYQLIKENKAWKIQAIRLSHDNAAKMITIKYIKNRNS